VEDTGIGIPEESQARIFDVFWQVDSSKTRKYGSIGLGLYIVKKLATLIHAVISVKSESGRGSTFTVSVGADHRPSTMAMLQRAIKPRNDCSNVDPAEL
jgi:signal transduction histidine kinase